MKESVDKNMEELTNKMMKDDTLQSPSLDFTSYVMSQIEESSPSEVTKYKPLISSWFWAVILIGLVALIALFAFGGVIGTTSWFDKINFRVLYNNRLAEGVSSLTISKTLVYAVVLLGVMMSIQIPLLKYYFNRRLEN